ncbi:MAG TPA: hypothetical protein VGH89_28070 [Pseudonocardia sp.]
MTRPRQTALAAPAAVLLVACIAMSAGTASAAGWKTNSCPPGYQLDPANSQQCLSIQPTGPQTGATGCTAPGYNLTGNSPDVCVDSQGRDTHGDPR